MDFDHTVLKFPSSLLKQGQIEDLQQKHFNYHKLTQTFQKLIRKETAEENHSFNQFCHRQLCTQLYCNLLTYSDSTFNNYTFKDV